MIKKKVHTISDESEFGDGNENEVNEPPNATLIDFDDCLMNDVGHVAANNDNNVVYNDQLYFEEPIQDNQNFVLDDLVCLWSCLKHCYLLCFVY